MKWLNRRRSTAQRVSPRSAHDNVMGCVPRNCEIREDRLIRAGPIAIPARSRLVVFHQQHISRGTHDVVVG